MNFKQKMKLIDNKDWKEKEINPSELSAQYNPDRFKLWAKTCIEVKENKFLNLKYSPHVHLLNLYNKNSGSIKTSLELIPYYKMHKNYGKSDEWIISKIKSFLDIYEDIKINGIKEPPIILTSPIVKNPYNESYEIFEGHHRCSISYFLDYPLIKCRIKTP